MGSTPFSLRSIEENEKDCSVYCCFSPLAVAGFSLRLATSLSGDGSRLFGSFPFR